MTDLDHDAFGGFRAFLAAAAGRTAPVKWQFVGRSPSAWHWSAPGSPATSRSTCRSVPCAAACGTWSTTSPRRCPAAAGRVHRRAGARRADGAGLPVAPDTAVDLVSGALAAIEPVAVDRPARAAPTPTWPRFAAGPDVLSVPVDLRLLESAGYLARFLEDGGWIAWGAVPPRPDRHVGRTSVAQAQRPVVRARAARLRPGHSCASRRSSRPSAGSALHTPAVAERVHRLAAEIGRAGQGPGDGDALLARRVASLAASVAAHDSTLADAVDAVARVDELASG